MTLTNKTKLRAAFVVLAALLSSNALGHQLGVAWVSVFEEGNTRLQVQLKAPYDAAGRPPAIAIELGDDCQALSHNSHAVEEGVTRLWRYQCEEALAGRELTVTGLNAQTPDAVVVLNYSNGEQSHITVRRNEPTITLGETPQNSLAQSSDYFPMGISHILGGYDHLLLVFLFWLMASGKHLLWVITSFTVAHSITLALAVLDVIAVPGVVAESLIAFSIALLAAELLRQHRQADYQSVTLRFPAAMALLFGLLHGLGFAGALAETGLPSENLWPSLLLFNLGVEVGQIAFVIAVALLWRLVSAVLSTNILSQGIPNLKPPMLFSIGGLSAFWFFERLLS